MDDPDEAAQTFPASDPVGHWAGESPEDVRRWSSSVNVGQPTVHASGEAEPAKPMP
jgi:hypothetical protein